MEKYVTLYQAIRLKEMGFNWGCTHAYSIETSEFFPIQTLPFSSQESMTIDDILCDCNAEYAPPKNTCISAPTLEQVAKWLRDVKKVFIEIIYSEDERKYTFNIISIRQNKRANFTSENDDMFCFEFEDALSKGIDKVLF